MKYILVGLSDEVIATLDNFIGIVKMTEQSIERPTEILSLLIVAGLKTDRELLTLEKLPDNLLRDEE